jgi:hypothetical protein
LERILGKLRGWPGRARAAAAASHAWQIPLLVLVVSGVLAARCWPMFLHPTLPAEDGKRIFAYFYSNRELEFLVREKAGYIPLLPNFLGFLAVRLPAPWSPYFLTLVPAGVSLVSFTWFARAEFSSVVSSRGVRLFACLLLALMPIGSFWFVCHTDYVIWNALFLLLLVSLLPGPARPLRALLGFLGRSFLIWSHPLSFVALPVQLLRVVWDRGWVQRVSAAAVVAMQALHVALGVSFRRARVHGAEDASDFWLETLPAGARYVQEIVVPRSLLGVNTAAALAEQPSMLPTILTLSLLGVVMLAAVLRPRWTARRTFGLLAYFVVVLSLAVVSSEVPDQNATRYAYVQSLCCILIACLAAAELGSRLRGKGRVVQAVLGAGTLVYASVLCLRDLENYRDERADNGERIAECMSEIAELERAHGGPCGFEHRCSKRKDWSFTVTPPECEW